MKFQPSVSSDDALMFGSGRMRPQLSLNDMEQFVDNIEKLAVGEHVRANKRLPHSDGICEVQTTCTGVRSESGSIAFKIERREVVGGSRVRNAETETAIIPKFSKNDGHTRGTRGTRAQNQMRQDMSTEICRWGSKHPSEPSHATTAGIINRSKSI